MSEFGVFLVDSEALVDGILLRVDSQLFIRCRPEVDAQAIRKGDQVTENVGEFLAGSCPVGFAQRLGLVFRLPLKNLEQFGGQDAHSQKNLSMALKLLPVPLGREPAE